MSLLQGTHGIKVTKKGIAAAERDDESGLYYMGARYYIPWLCRWCAPDPINNEWYNLGNVPELCLSSETIENTG